jgi:2-keto-3-deoxy-L-rhamnonate aldolase RhmA
MNGKEIRKVLSAGGRVFGTALEGIGNARQLNIYLETGMDFVFIDNEHNPLDRNQTSFACSLFSKSGIAPIVRIPKPDAYLAAMVVDGGAYGVIAPYVETVEDVWDIVAAVKYRPLKGKALKELKTSMKFPSEESKRYIDKMNENGIVVIMIESAAGLQNLDRILEIPGVDAILIGPNDLSISYGVPEMYEHPVFINAVQNVMEKTLQAAVGFGIHFSTLDLQKYWTLRGQNFIVYSTDTFIAYNYMKQGFEELKKVKSEYSR